MYEFSGEWVDFQLVKNWKTGKDKMKRTFGTFLLFVLLTHSALAQAVYNQDSKDIKFTHISTFNLTKQSSVNSVIERTGRKLQNDRGLQKELKR